MKVSVIISFTNGSLVFELLVPVRCIEYLLNSMRFRQPILADEIQTFKALITVHKVLQEGHPITLREAMSNKNWIDSLNRGMSGEGMRGYGPLIKEYVYFLLAKLSFHQQHPEFNGTFEYEEYISLKSINDPNEGYETISDLMQLQDKIEQFQKLIFSHFRSGANNECRISALVPLVQESYGIYKFITSMLRAMHTSRFNKLHSRLKLIRYSNRGRRCIGASQRSI